MGKITVHVKIPLKVAVSCFQHFPVVLLGQVNITTHYQVMLQLSYQVSIPQNGPFFKKIVFCFFR